VAETDGRLRTIFREKLPLFHWTAVETGAIGQGVPDSNFAHAGAEGWVEYKQTDGWNVTLRPEQVGWISKRVRHGGRVFIAVRRWHDGGPKKGPPCDELYLLPGSLAALAKAGGLRAVESGILGRYEGGPSRWDWVEIALHLSGRLQRVRGL
jgi:hypothetical protein